MLCYSSSLSSSSFIPAIFVQLCALSPSYLLCDSSSLSPSCVLCDSSSLSPSCVLCDSSSLSPSCVLCDSSSLSTSCVLCDSSSLSPSCVLCDSSSLSSSCELCDLNNLLSSWSEIGWHQAVAVHFPHTRHLLPQKELIKIERKSETLYYPGAHSAAYLSSWDCGTS